jgi:hypothetical protein
MLIEMQHMLHAERNVTGEQMQEAVRLGDSPLAAANDF